MKINNYVIEPNANLIGADLSETYLNGADLSEAYLSGADLRRADLRRANLSMTDLRRADLRRANLSMTDLSGANLNGACLREANLNGADLREANLSGADGLLCAKDYLNQFKSDKRGIYVFKAQSTHYTQPKGWKIEPGAFLCETANHNRTTECGCGVNFATKEWIQNNIENAVTWRCLIHWEDVVNVCVPYNTDGKARCERLELVEKI